MCVCVSLCVYVRYGGLLEPHAGPRPPCKLTLAPARSFIKDSQPAYQTTRDKALHRAGKNKPAASHTNKRTSFRSGRGNPIIRPSGTDRGLKTRRSHPAAAPLQGPRGCMGPRTSLLLLRSAPDAKKSPRHRPAGPRLRVQGRRPPLVCVGRQPSVPFHAFQDAGTVRGLG